MEHMIDYANAEGIGFIEVLPENVTMLTMCRRLGFGIAQDPNGSKSNAREAQGSRRDA